jgi:chromosome condensin MukBEF complex kleisin-like MukF subunit
MAEWKPFLKQILQPMDFLKEEKMDLFMKIMRERAQEISDVLVGLSKHKWNKRILSLENLLYQPSFKNIKTNEDIAREEFGGEIQRYLLGMKEDALIHACIALEAGLLVRD